MDSVEGRRNRAQELMQALPWPSFRKGLTMTIAGKVQKLEVQSLSQQLQEIPSFALPFLFTLITPADKVSAFHCAQARVQVIYVRKDDKNQECTPIIVERTGKGASDHLLVIVEEGGKGSIIEFNESSAQFRSEGTEIFLAKGSSLEYVAVQNHGKSTEAYSFRKARLEAGSALSFVSCTLGGRLSKEQLSIALDGDHARLKQAVLFYGVEHQQFDVEVDIEHGAKGTESSLSAQGCVAGHAKAIMQGRIHIGKDAHDASGFESSEMLILDEANGNAVPILEIDNPDVSSGHSAKIGHIDAGKMFYLQSRGLTDAEAKKLLIEGFFTPILGQVLDPGLQEKIMGLVEQKLR